LEWESFGGTQKANPKVKPKFKKGGNLAQRERNPKIGKVLKEKLEGINFPRN